MTCYMRHLTGMYELLGIEYDKENRRRVDAVLRPLIGMGPENSCSEVWAAYKALSPNERDALCPSIRAGLGL